MWKWKWCLFLNFPVWKAFGYPPAPHKPLLIPIPSRPQWQDVGGHAGSVEAERHKAECSKEQENKDETWNNSNWKSEGKNMSFLHNEEKHQNLRKETYFLSIFWICAKHLSLLWLDFGETQNNKQKLKELARQSTRHQTVAETLHTPIFHRLIHRQRTHPRFFQANLKMLAHEVRYRTLLDTCPPKDGSFPIPCKATGSVTAFNQFTGDYRLFSLQESLFNNHGIFNRNKTQIVEFMSFPHFTSQEICEFPQLPPPKKKITVHGAIKPGHWKIKACIKALHIVIKPRP